MIDNEVSLEEFWGVVRRLHDDAKVCLASLQETPEDDERQKKFWRRMYALAVFSLIDGLVYRMIFHAHAARARDDVVFSLDELTRLEKSYDFDEDEEGVTVFSETKMLNEIKFAFNAFARVHYCDYILPTHDPGWELIEEIAHIRNIMQYPRNAEQLEVYDENVDDLVHGLLWLMERMGDLLECSRSQAAEKIAALEEQAAAMIENDEVIM
ncbi:MAG: hypothetical protein ICV60_10610 [Pyrinomonadaceae bacterium]|nr:hypothetical protein [Pyrinomonadaceae bacterium]